MKKLITIAAMAMLVGATVGKAQIIVTTVVNEVILLEGPVNIDVKVKLSDGTAPAVTGVKFAQVQEISGSTTSTAFNVLGTAITDTTNETVDATNVTSTVSLSTNVFMFSDDIVDLGKGKFATALFSEGAAPFGMSNSVWLAVGGIKESAKGTNVSAKIEGIWKEGDTAFKGSVKTSKVQ